MSDVFKNKNREEGVGITDLINIVLRLLQVQLKEVVSAIRDILGPIKPYNKEW